MKLTINQGIAVISCENSQVEEKEILLQIAELPHLDGVYAVRFKDAEISDNILMAVINIFEFHWCKFQTIYFENARINKKIAERITYLLQNGCLRDLEFNGGIEAECIDMLVIGFKTYKTLTRLSIANSELTSYDFYKLFAPLTKHPDLDLVQIHRMEISDNQNILLALRNKGVKIEFTNCTYNFTQRNNYIFCYSKNVAETYKVLTKIFTGKELALPKIKELKPCPLPTVETKKSPTDKTAALCKTRKIKTIQVRGKDESPYEKIHPVAKLVTEYAWDGVLQPKSSCLIM